MVGVGDINCVCGVFVGVLVIVVFMNLLVVVGVECLVVVFWGWFVVG